MTVPGSLDIYPDQGALHRAAAEQFVSVSTACVREQGRCTIALAGGATPNGLYALLATKPFRSRVPWSELHVFWGDERCVPPEDPRSNYRAAYELLLSHVPIPASHVHRMQGEIDPWEAAHAYETELRAHFGTPSGAARFTADARFDLVLLGLGTDGHTASLFPDGDAQREQQRWVTAAYARSADMWRVTLTPAIINAAARIQFLVAGEEKREIVREILTRETHAHAGSIAADDAAHVHRYPAERIAPLEGDLRWMIDNAAAPGGIASAHPDHRAN